MYDKQILLAKNYNCNALDKDLMKVKSKQRNVALRFFAGNLKNKRNSIEREPRISRRSNQQFEI